MNPILLLVYNTTDAQLRLAKLCVESIFTQTIPVHLLLVDNGSSLADTATRDWTEAPRCSRSTHARKCAAIGRTPHQPAS